MTPTSRNQERSRRAAGQGRWVLAVVPLLFVTACTGAGGPDSDAADGAGGGDVRNPDVIVHHQNGEPATLDPARAEQGEKGEAFIDNVYERLVDVGPESRELIPSLATEVPTQDNGLVSEDRLTYTFPLREDVTFHDGTELHRRGRRLLVGAGHGDEPPGGPGVGARRQRRQRARRSTSPPFEVTLTEPDASFLYSVVLNTVASVVSPEAVEENGGVEAGHPERVDGHEHGRHRPLRLRRVATRRVAA